MSTSSAPYLALLRQDRATLATDRVFFEQCGCAEDQALSVPALNLIDAALAFIDFELQRCGVAA